MKIAYGQEIETDNDEYIKMTENVSLAHVDAGDPGTALVDFFPIRESPCSCGDSLPDHQPKFNTCRGGSRVAGSTVSFTVSPLARL